MGLIAAGSTAPPIPGVDFGTGPRVLLFYKVTCPVCQVAAPKADRLERAYPGRLVAIGQDPEEELSAFGREYGMDVPAIPDLPPYPTSDAYGIEVVPTLVLVGEEGKVLDTVVSWDRDGYNRVSGRLAELTGSQPAVISDPGDGLPPFRPG